MTKTNALTLNDTFTYTFPATYGYQIKTFYQINVPVATLIRLLRLDDTGSTMDRSQRTVNEARAKAFADYVISNLKRDMPFIVPTVTGVITTPEGVPEPQFYCAGDLLTEAGVQSYNPSFSSLGALVVSMESNFTLFDGQHRARGLAIALERISKDKKLAGITNFRALTVPVMAYKDLSLAERQMFFSDINGTMSKPAASISIAYDHRDALSQFAVELAHDLPFAGLVDFERNTIGAKSEYLFPLKTLKDAIKTLLALPNKCTEKDITDNHKEFVRKTFAVFSRAMGWSALSFGSEETPAEYRNHSILTHTVMIKAICEAAKAIENQYRMYEGVDMNKLAELDYSRDSDDFKGRCIDAISGKMIMNATAVHLTASKLIQAVGVKLHPELKSLEKSHFPTLLNESETKEPVKN